MPSPGRPKSSQTPRATVGDIQSRRNIRSSGPTRFPFTQSIPLPRDQEDAFSSPELLRKSQGKWPRSSEPAFHKHTESRSHFSNVHDHRTSVEPSHTMSTTAAMPSPLSLYPDKHSGFRATIRRMFGSRAQRQPAIQASSEIDYSDPGNLMAIDQSQTANSIPPQVPRPLQLPARPVTRSSALGSHAPAASLQGLPGGPDATRLPPRRRNTLPSLALSDAEAKSFTHPLTSFTDKADVEHMTVASDWSDNRRSRSLEALTKTHGLRSLNGHQQDREAEIAFWRHSVLIERVPSIHVASSVDELESPPASPQLAEHPPLTIKSAQSFDFGLNMGDESITLEDRVNTLEVKVFDFEYAIAKLQGVELPKPMLQPQMLRSTSSHDLFLRTSKHSVDTESSARRMMSFSRPRPVNIVAAEPIEADSANHKIRSDTVRPQTSHGVSERPLSSSSVRITRNEYEALMMVISDEKEARQQMEMQILNLQKELQQLQAPVFAAINYPTPELDNVYDTTTTTTPPLRAKTLHRTTHFDFAPQTARNESRFSVDSDTEFQCDDFENTYKIPADRLGLNLTKSSIFDVSAI